MNYLAYFQFGQVALTSVSCAPEIRLVHNETLVTFIDVSPTGTPPPKTLVQS